MKTRLALGVGVPLHEDPEMMFKDLPFKLLVQDAHDLRKPILKLVILAKEESLTENGSRSFSYPFC